MRTFEIFMEVKKVKSIHTFTFWKLHFGTIWQDLKKRPSSSCQPKNLSSFVWRTINLKNLFLSKNLKKENYTYNSSASEMSTIDLPLKIMYLFHALSFQNFGPEVAQHKTLVGGWNSNLMSFSWQQSW